ncbi:lysophospholipid acyltransferase family protein [Methylobrevis pamukkalensis]|uniref:1-acyl-sn-glycerol-3-phosphate acyltransferase n=1 Tax=Methylobrevis pamukkalensis TaxID=1439726 RepID=A0A1E3HB26_9HYPH|nr:lysophospholipid acyltransferase family protein [Methylobrevis pamukkalensis]ODN72651.1 1-acyl-sn-glycerol-3-phosphate acyltransferase [Methylobrevis pamukkalensis]
MFARSLLFNLLLYTWMILSMTLGMPLMLLPRRKVLAIAKWWFRGLMALHRITIGVQHRFQGLDRIPQGPLIVACKHQSMWETLALVPLFDDAVFVLKRELTWIPVFGWWLMRMSMIPVDRGKGSRALATMSAATREALAAGRQVLIFPEGTRRELGAEPAYKIGIAKLYMAFDVPCLPVALDSGLVWRRRSFLQRPGTITVSVLEPIPPGLPPREFFTRMQTRIETRCDELLLEAAARPEGTADLPEVARRRIAVLQAAAQAGSSETGPATPGTASPGTASA